MEIEYPTTTYAQEPTFNDFNDHSLSPNSEATKTSENQQFQNLIVPIPRYKCKKLENRQPSLSLNDEIMLGVRANRVLQLAEATGLLKTIKIEEQTVATDSSSEEKSPYGDDSFDSEDHFYGRKDFNDALFKVDISPVRRKKMLEIVKKFRIEREGKSQNIAERYYGQGNPSGDLSIELRLMLGRSRAVNRMASDSLDKMDDLFMEIEKTTAKINGEEF